MPSERTELRDRLRSYTLPAEDQPRAADPVVGAREIVLGDSPGAELQSQLYQCCGDHRHRFNEPTESRSRILELAGLISASERFRARNNRHPAVAKAQVKGGSAEEHGERTLCAEHVR
jgi:hypothetical protein